MNALNQLNEEVLQVSEGITTSVTKITDQVILLLLLGSYNTVFYCGLNDGSN